VVHSSVPMRTFLLAFVVLWLGAGTASGATVSIEDDWLLVTAAPGEANDLRVVDGGAGVYALRDAGASLEAGTGCTSVSSSEAHCQAEFVHGVVVRLGDGNDRLDASEACGIEYFCQLSAYAGPGADHVVGSPGLDWLDGDAGEDVVAGLGGEACSPRGGCSGDTLLGGSGEDVLLGGPGPDRILADPGADLLLGGGGSDEVSYHSRRVPLRVSLDRTANDGAAGERDNVGTDVERVEGGHAADTLVGNRRANSLAGGGGRDRLFGRSGADFLIGQVGRDLLDAGPGNDELILDAGRDRARGSGGDDLILAEDRVRDIVDGGAGRDRADVDSGVDYAVRVERFFESPFFSTARPSAAES
jgi:Ca2+-binding RTX toxin-like protein